MFPISRGIFRSRFASAIHLTYVLKSSVPLASIFYRNIKRLYSQKPQLYTERHYSCSKDMSSTIYAIPHMLKYFFFPLGRPYWIFDASYMLSTVVDVVKEVSVVNAVREMRKTSHKGCSRRHLPATLQVVMLKRHEGSFKQQTNEKGHRKRTEAAGNSSFARQPSAH